MIKLIHRRVDCLIDVLLRIEEDCFFKVAQKQIMGIVNQQEIKKLHQHQRGLQIEPEGVTVPTIFIPTEAWEFISTPFGQPQISLVTYSKYIVSTTRPCIMVVLFGLHPSPGVYLSPAFKGINTALIMQ